MRHEQNLNSLEDKCRELRGDVLRMICKAGSGHPGGSLSAIEILTVLYNRVIKHNPQNPNWGERDRFVLSKGHICPALYAVLADCGYYDKAELNTLRQYGSILQGHPYMFKTPGLDVSSGSLGQGLSIAVGMALSAKVDQKQTRVYCLMGDGELQEGQIWEAAMAAGHYKLSNLCGIVDYNGLQIDGEVEKVMGIAPLADKWSSFNWNVLSVDGHCISDLEKVFGSAKAQSDKPTVIIAKTVKGKGVSFMENDAAWHGAAPSQEQLAKALKELQLMEVKQ